MKPIIALALIIIFSASLNTIASAGTVTTTKTTTTVTTTQYGCKSSTHKHKHHKKHRYYSCSSYDCGYSYYWDQCPGGQYDCYFDLQGVNYRQDYYPITYDHDVKYRCLYSDDPSSCS